MNNRSSLNREDAFIQRSIRMNEMRKRNELVDFVLFNDNGDQVWGHLIVMASSCPAILELAESGSIERRLLLRNISAETLEQIVNSMYTGELHLTRDNVNNILTGAFELRMLHLQTRCLDFLENNFNVNREDLIRRCLG
ncbi:kelch-like protein 41a isoform X2 [Adelges cooleyi]|uniref:kelch-like protein 41a isoform X2 n=1 Tax=Adelges cooleyi TaxID=133065 RepID=UPI00217F269A|nr:kelch-like protein 41a isoform X2 [Adelges cooleyi]